MKRVNWQSFWLGANAFVTFDCMTDFLMDGHGWHLFVGALAVVGMFAGWLLLCADAKEQE